ncbi:hypothetical protein HKD37_17G048255 [Glycine soja]
MATPPALRTGGRNWVIGRCCRGSNAGPYPGRWLLVHMIRTRSSYSKCKSRPVIHSTGRWPPHPTRADGSSSGHTHIPGPSNTNGYPRELADSCRSNGSTDPLPVISCHARPPLVGQALA